MAACTKIKEKNKKMFWALGFLVLVVFFIVVAVFWASCSPVKCCVFDPACCSTVCSTSCSHSSYIPFSGNSPGGMKLFNPSVALGPTEYVAFVIGAAAVAKGTLADLETHNGEAAGLSSPFTSKGLVRDLTGYVQAKADSGTATVTLSLYVAPKSADVPKFASVLSGSFTATTTQAYGYINQSNSSSSAAVSAGDLYIILVTTSAPITLYSAGGGFTYRF